MVIITSLAFMAGLFLQVVSAQQYAGDVITNKLPKVSGAELAYFRITDPAGVANHLTLTNFYSLQKDGSRLVPSEVKRAVIVIHGKWRDAGTSMQDVLGALHNETDKNINRSSVAVVAPFFFDGSDKDKGYPYNSTNPVTGEPLTGPHQSWSNALVWKGSQWAGGGTNQYPHAHRTVSTYEVLDQLVQYFANKALFPNMNQIVVAGHSLGGQTVQRYAAVGISPAQLGVKVPITHFLANPDSFVWLNSSRPLPIGTCSTYDVWRSGLSNYAEYPSIYNTDLVIRQGRAAVLKNFYSKTKAYAHGTQDFGNQATTCGPASTGANRSARFYNFLEWFPPSCAKPNSTAMAHCDTVDLVNTGHHSSIMFASPAGRARLLEDNFYGNGLRAADFAYPPPKSMSGHA